MSLFTTVKDIFTKTEIKEETFEYESIDSYLAKQGIQEGEEPKSDIVFQCDRIVDATYQMEGLRAEYKMVTSYFTDIQTIEELPPNIQEQIVDIAKKIALLEDKTSEFLHSDDRISDENFRMIQGMEKELADIFGRLKELEDMDMKIKRDMKHLEEEKNFLKYTKESAKVRQAKVRDVLIGFGVISVLTVLVLAVIGVFADVNMIIPILLILLVVAGIAAMAIVAYKQLSYEFKLCELKENKAINLMNKVKVKYVNNTSTLEYLYSKYHVRSLRELEYLYDQYLLMLDEVKKYQRTAGDLRELCDMLSKLLFAHGVKDPDIWTKQSLALIDNREMVEVKHSLNVRRQKLRDQIAYNEDLRMSGFKEIQQMLKENPELRDQVRKELEVYHINIQ